MICACSAGVAQGLASGFRGTDSAGNKWQAAIAAVRAAAPHCGTGKRMRLRRWIVPAGSAESREHRAAFAKRGAGGAGPLLFCAEMAEIEHSPASAQEHSGRRYLITGITDHSSLALGIAEALVHRGATAVFTGLGRTEHHKGLSEKAAAYLERSYQDFRNVIADRFGGGAMALTMDLSLDGSIADACETFQKQGIVFDGVLHAVAMDRTIRAGSAINLLETSRDDFMSAMDISAYSLIALCGALWRNSLLSRGASIVALSYLGAERVMHHPYKNIGVAKAALERIVRELAMELGSAAGVKVNVVRFSPYAASKAGGAIPGLAAAVERADADSPLGNAGPEDLSDFCAFLLAGRSRVTGQVLHVDGGYSIRA